MYDNMAMGSILVGQEYYIAGCFGVVREQKNIKIYMYYQFFVQVTIAYSHVSRALESTQSFGKLHHQRHGRYQGVE